MSHDQHPFRIFRPAVAVPWLPQVLDSIEGLFRRVMPTVFRLHDIETADLPTASDANLGGVVYDTTLERPAYSTGAAWVTLAPYDADVAAIAGLTTAGLIVRTGAGTAATRSVVAPAAGITVSNGDGVAGNPTLALANDLAALEALSGTNTIYYRSAADTWTAVTIGGNLGFSGGTLGSSLGTIATQAANNVTITGGSITGITTLLGGNGSAQMVMTMNGGSTGGAFRGQRAGVNHWFVGDTAAALGSGTGLIHYVYGSDPILFYTAGTLRATIDATGLDVVGLARCNSFRIDQTPTAETPTATHTITISCNGTNFKLLCVAA